MDIQTIAAILFIISLTIFLVVKRKQIAIQKILFPVLYFAMYRTNWGLKSMSKAAERFTKPLKYWAYFGVGIGFLGMGLIAFELIFNIYRMLSQPGGVAGVGIIQPFAPKIPGTIFVPFFYFVISIFIIAVIHEFSHGVISRIHNLKVKSSGFAFLGLIFPILPAAFVEPDEKQMQKKSMIQQLSIFAAGPFSNIILAFVVLAFLFVVFVPINNAMMETQGMVITDFMKDGVESPAENAGLKKGELMTQINGVSLKEPKNLHEVMGQQKPGDTLIITTNETVYRVILGEKPIGKSMIRSWLVKFGFVSDGIEKDNDTAFLGIMAMPHSVVRESFREKFGNIIPKIIAWFAGLFTWLFILNLGIGLFNLVPLGPIDGGRMLKTVLYKYFQKEKAHKVFYWVSTICLFALFINIFLAIVG